MITVTLSCQKTTVSMTQKEINGILHLTCTRKHLKTKESLGEGEAGPFLGRGEEHTS